jgi:O-antigen/teichoic acid export membrane protein
MSQTYYQSFIKDNAVVIGGHILVYMKGIILMPLIIKTVGVTTYGGFILLTSILGIVFGLSSFGAGFKAQRFMPSAKNMKERGELFNQQFYFNIFTILIFSFLFVLIEKPLNIYFFKNEVTFSFWIVPTYLLLYLFYSQSSFYFRYTSRINYMTLASLCFPYLHIVFIFLYLYIYGSISIDTLVLLMALSALLIAIPSFGIIFREIGVKISFYNTESLITDIKLGFPLVLSFIVDSVLAGSDRYFIAIFLSVTDVGYYIPGYMLGSLIIFIPKAMGTVLPQLLSKAIDNDKEFEAHTMVNYAIKFFLLLAIPFVFGSIALGKPILTLLANHEVAEKAYWVTPIVALGTLFYGLNIILSNIMFVRLKTKAMFKMNLIAALFSLLANSVLFYFFRDIIVAAITTFLSFFIAFLYCYKIAIKEWFVNFYPTIIAKTIAASAIMYGAVFLITTTQKTPNTLVIVSLTTTAGILVYIGMLIIFKTFSRKELIYLRGIL